VPSSVSHQLYEDYFSTAYYHLQRYQLHQLGTYDTSFRGKWLLDFRAHNMVADVAIVPRLNSPGETPFLYCGGSGEGVDVSNKNEAKL